MGTAKFAIAVGTRSTASGEYSAATRSTDSGAAATPTTTYYQWIASPFEAAIHRHWSQRGGIGSGIVRGCRCLRGGSLQRYPRQRRQPPQCGAVLLEDNADANTYDADTDDTDDSDDKHNDSDAIYTAGADNGAGAANKLIIATCQSIYTISIHCGVHQQHYVDRPNIGVSRHLQT
jgi:hypothetical protein